VATPGDISEAVAGVIDVDVHKGGVLKRGEPEGLVDATLSSFHAFLRQTCGVEGGEPWGGAHGDGAMFKLPSGRAAVRAALRLMQEISKFNSSSNRLSCDVVMRVGAAAGAMPDVPPAKRGEAQHETLDIAGHHQKDCPPGKVLISNAAFREAQALGLASLFRPASTGTRHGGFVTRERAVSPRELHLLEGLTARQKAGVPAIAFPRWEKILPEPTCHLAALSGILREPLVVVLGETRQNGGERMPLLRGVTEPAATSDAVGPIETLAAAGASANVVATVDQWEDTQDEAAQKHIVVIGSAVVNVYAYAFNRMEGLPVRFESPLGTAVDIVASGEDGKRTFPPGGRHAVQSRHYGLVLLCRSPVNPDNCLIWVAGITGMATQAAARFVRDMVVENPEGVIRRRAQGAFADPIACVVSPAPPEGVSALPQYLGRWRIADYQIEWMADREGKTWRRPQD
jgi:hypothetical protein